MTLKTFTRDFRRGLGSAIVELKSNPKKEKYHNIVMKCCLKDIAHDTQIEGTKGHYLYTAIKIVGNCEEYLKKISEKYNEKLYWRISCQLFDILCCFADDGYAVANEVLENRYKWFRKHLPTMKNYSFKYCERECFENLMVRKLNGGLEGFKQCIDDMGEMIIEHGSDDCIFYDWFLCEAEEKIGEDIFSYLKNSEKKSVIAFYRSYSELKNERSTYKREIETVTIKHLIDKANELVATNNPFRMSGLPCKFAKNATADELKLLAETALQESSDFIKTSLLTTFHFVDFPLDIELLFPYVYYDNEYLREVVNERVLSRIKDRRIRAIVPELFKNGDVDGALALLKLNFEIDDEALIRKYAMRSKKIEYVAIRSVIDIYKDNRSKSCGDILLHFYKNVKCTHCRCDIVEAMINNGVISQSVIEECKYDSYEDTRELVKSMSV